MKIAFIYDVLYPYVKGGAERRNYELAQKLSRDHEVHLFGMKYWEGEKIIQTPEGIFLHGVCPARSLYVQGRRSIYQALYFSLKLVCALFREKFDVIDCTSTPYFPLMVCKIYAMLTGCVFIASWMDYWGAYWHEYLSGWKGWIAHRVEKFTLTLPDHIIAISDHTKQLLLQAGQRSENISTIGCGINLSEIEAVYPSDFQSDLIYVGRLMREKRVDLLLYVVDALIKCGLVVRCCIVGDGPEKLCLEQLCRDLKITEYVTFYGFLERHYDVYALMKSSKLFTFFSEREGFGIVAVEANACGLPVVMVNAQYNAATWLVESGQNGIVCESDVQEITQRIAQLLQDHDMRMMMGDKARIYAQQFDWDIIARQHEWLYQQLFQKK